MRYLQLEIGYPPGARHPMHQFLVDQESLRRAYLRHWNFSNPEQVTSLFHVVGDVPAGREEYLAALDAVETIREYEVTPVDDRSFYVYVREAADEHARRFRELLADTDLLVVPPIEYGADGEMVFEIAGEAEGLRGVVSGLPDHLSVSVDRLGEYDAYRESLATALTSRQREVLAVARERGYYEIPRRTSVREIADELGCSKSTVSNHLRKAESRLVALYDDRSTTAGGDPS
jgi:DNA-binding CsgD family transcriptional regulator